MRQKKIILQIAQKFLLIEIPITEKPVNQSVS